MKAKALNTLKKLWSDESGQGATEYILLLVVVVGVGLMFKDRIEQIITGKLEQLSGQVSQFGN